MRYADDLEARTRALIEKLVDTADAKERAALRTEWATVRNEQATLAEELALLRARLKAMQVEEARRRVESAEAEWNAAREASVEARRALDAALDAKRRVLFSRKPADMKALEYAVIDAKEQGRAATAALEAATRKLNEARAALAELERAA